MIQSHSEFLQIAFKSYDNPILTSLSDFEADLKRFGYMNTMIKRYQLESDLSKLRAGINHIIIILNSFGVETGIRLIRYKTHEENSISIETVLYFLKMIPETKKLDFKLLNTLESL